MDMDNINNTNQQGVDLHMSPNGFEKASDELKRFDTKSHHVYVHVGSEGNLENQVLRIGSAQSSVYRRWMTHKNTFLWSIGKCDTLTRRTAESYPNYLLFFASLFELRTKLYVYSFSSKEQAKGCEEALINYYGPIWERYYVLSGKKRNFPKLARNFPKLTGKNTNREIVASVAGLGGALAAIEKQRDGNDPFSQPIQDLINTNFESLKPWESNNSNLLKLGEKRVSINLTLIMTVEDVKENATIDEIETAAGKHLDEFFGHKYYVEVHDIDVLED